MAVVRPGEVVHVGEAASVRFIGDDAFLLRVLELGEDSYHGWGWVYGDQLGAAGEVVAKRGIFVHLAGLSRVAAPAASSRSDG